jgi:hypothetical protein
LVTLTSWASVDTAFQLVLPSAPMRAKPLASWPGLFASAMKPN